MTAEYTKVVLFEENRIGCSTCPFITMSTGNEPVCLLAWLDYDRGHKFQETGIDGKPIASIPIDTCPNEFGIEKLNDKQAA